MKTVASGPALAWRWLWSQPLAAVLNLLLLSLGLAVVTLLLLLQAQLGRAFERDLAGIDAVVGAKGSPLQLILAGVFHIDVPPGNVPLAEIEKIVAKTPGYVVVANITGVSAEVAAFGAAADDLVERYADASQVRRQVEDFAELPVPAGQPEVAVELRRPAGLGRGRAYDGRPNDERCRDDGLTLPQRGRPRCDARSEPLHLRHEEACVVGTHSRIRRPRSPSRH